LQAARESLDLPITGIGGIDRDNAAQALAAGADLLAVIHAIFGASDPGAATRELVRTHAEYAG
ncbi:MAG: thiamine phosphate synthase, partial [Gammaproteobacteria bacterium]|nr:thiamine phosphate synthase [Gammaproteobacteria bacterium]